MVLGASWITALTQTVQGEFADSRHRWVCGECTLFPLSRRWPFGNATLSTKDRFGEAAPQRQIS